MKMRQLTWRLILPLTIVSFGLFTKWWYVLPVDAPDTMMAGFPLAFVSDGWFTSMSLQIFITEFIIDFLVYFLFWLFIGLLIIRRWKVIKTPGVLTGVIWTLSALMIFAAVILLSVSEKVYKVRRDWDMQILVTGYKFTWANQDRPEFAKYDPNKR